MAFRSFMTDAGYQMMMRYYLQAAVGVKVVVLAFFVKVICAKPNGRMCGMPLA